MLASTIALDRFGLGGRPDDQPPVRSEKMAAPADGAVPAALPGARPGARARTQVVAQLADYFEAAADGRPGQAPDAARLAADRHGSRNSSRSPAEIAGKRYLRQTIRDDYVVMNSARLDSALTTPSPFVERLVHFWANHFAVSVDKLPVIGLAGLLEFEAIRPHVLGRFSRHAARGRAASGDAALSRPGAVDRPRFARRPCSPHARQQAARPQRESRPRNHGAAHARRAHRLQPGRRHRIRAGADRLDGRRPRPRPGGASDRRQRPPGSSSSPRRSTSRARARSSASTYRQDGEAQAPAVLLDLAASPRTAQPSRDQARAPFCRRRPAGGAGRPARPRPISHSGGDLPSGLSRADRIARRPGRRGRSSSRTPGNGRCRRSARSARAMLEPMMAAGVLTPARPADLAAGLARRLGRYRRRAGPGPTRWCAASRSRSGSRAKAAATIDARALAEKLFPAVAERRDAHRDRARGKPRGGLALLLVSPEFVRR